MGKTLSFQARVLWNQLPVQDSSCWGLVVWGGFSIGEVTVVVIWNYTSFICSPYVDIASS